MSAPIANAQHHTDMNNNTAREFCRNIAIGSALTAPIWIVVIVPLAVRP